MEVGPKWPEQTKASIWTNTVCSEEPIFFFGKGHLSTLGASRNSVFLVVFSAKCFDPGGLLQ